MQQLPDALAPLAAYNQFVLWIIAERHGKQVKLPVNYKTAEVSDAHDPNCWGDVQTIINTAKLYGPGYGVGFVFTENDPFYFCDIDKCLEPDNATWSPVAQDLMARLPGAAVEVSQSGRGLHIIGTGITSEHSCKNIDLGLELYTEGRFVALTGTNIIGNAATNNAATGGALVDLYFPPKITARGDEWKSEPLTEWNGPTDNDQLIEKMLAATSASAAFGSRASFKELWEGNTDALGDYFPDPEGVRLFDGSSADAALAQHLAFWTGCNHQRMLDIMWRSGLIRDKWSRPDYLIRTITRAVSLQTTVYTAGGVGDADQVLKLKGTPAQIAFANTIIERYNDGRIATMTGPALNAKFWIENQDKTVDELITMTTPIDNATNPMGSVDGPELTEGYQFLGVTQQLEHFKGCVYIQDAHRIITPNGSMLRAEQFNATYGGYSFQMESDSGGKTSKKAWEAFTESQAIRYPKADSMCFRPDLPFGELVHHEDQTLVNVYLEIKTPCKPGDPAPFINHLKKLIPDERDQVILLSYMAGCVQYKGLKFQWAPLIQGAEGNGKTLFTRCIEAAVGERYTHWPRADEIDEKFNDWLFNKILIGIEDIYVPNHKQEIIEILKPMITNDRLAKRAMQAGQVMASVCANFIINTNHKDGLRKTANDRRFAMFYTAQQDKEDIIADGMDGSYFPDLYDWLKGRNKYAGEGKDHGYAIVADYLQNYAIPDEFNPGLFTIAPITSSTAEAIEVSVGGVEQEILEAIDENRVGFMGGWISSIALEKLLLNIGAARRIPVNKRRDLLKTLGYDWHPNLHKGRTKSPIMIDDGKKPKLYMKIDHPACSITDAHKIAQAYQDAQGVLGATTAANAFNKPA